MDHTFKNIAAVDDKSQLFWHGAARKAHTVQTNMELLSEKSTVLLEASDSLYQQTLNKEEKIRRVLRPGNTCKLYEEQHKGQKHQNFLILLREPQVSRGAERVQITISLFEILHSSDQFPQTITTLVPSFRLEKLRIAYLEL